MKRNRTKVGKKEEDDALQEENTADGISVSSAHVNKDEGEPEESNSA